MCQHPARNCAVPVLMPCCCTAQVQLRDSIEQLDLRLGALKVKMKGERLVGVGADQAGVGWGRSGVIWGRVHKAGCAQHEGWVRAKEWSRGHGCMAWGRAAWVK